MTTHLNEPQNTSSDSSCKFQEIPPEELQLFHEFQSYVRSIYIAASDGAVQSLQKACDDLNKEVTSLGAMIEYGRESYKEMFKPAIEHFQESSERILTSMLKVQNDNAKIIEDCAIKIAEKTINECEIILNKKIKQLQVFYFSGFALLTVLIVILVLYKK